MRYLRTKNVRFELDQIEEEKRDKGYDGPPVEEDDDQGKGANSKQGICKEEWDKSEE